ncbi:uncharacterized protein TNCV_545441 [Trichonephila clavipes]|nr:uncharacterized protein TNCV_545441 [Trichonephila clavipes]
MPLRLMLRILWKESPEDPVKTFEMKTVPYGTVSAPFLATGTLLQLSKDEEKNIPLAEPVLRENVYTDNVLCGAASLMEAKALKKQLSGILKRGGMELHKWVELKDSYTKRCVLSTIARLFDPLGLLGPVVARAKIFMQSLWSLKIDWIDELLSERAKEWHRFLEDFNNVSSICIGRCIVHPQATRVELHGFADASEKCYGVVIYCRSQSPDDATTVKLVTSKSRVAPVKSVTMPRLELCATLLLAKLVKIVQTALQMKTNPVYPFLDKDGVLRVGGRLCNSVLNFESKFAIILPCNHKLMNLIVEYFHLKYFHLGPQALLYQVRQRFWPARGRNVCRKIVHDCLVCFKVKPTTCEQIMGNLPKKELWKIFHLIAVALTLLNRFGSRATNSVKRHNGSGQPKAVADWEDRLITRSAVTAPDSSLSTIRPRSLDLSPIDDMMGMRLHLPGNVDDLAQQLEQIWQEIPKKTIRVLYHSVPRRVAAASRLNVGQYLTELVTL